MTVDYQKCIEMGIPVTIPFPKETVKKMAEAGLEFIVGEELFKRLSSRTPELGWDPEMCTWAGIPILVNPKMPRRSLQVVRNEDPSSEMVEVFGPLSGFLSATTIISYIEDIDDPVGVIKEREEAS